jgi:hypothetical protein
VRTRAARAWPRLCRTDANVAAAMDQRRLLADRDAGAARAGGRVAGTLPRPRGDLLMSPKDARAAPWATLDRSMTTGSSEGKSTAVEPFTTDNMNMGELYPFQLSRTVRAHVPIHTYTHTHTHTHVGALKEGPCESESLARPCVSRADTDDGMSMWVGVGGCACTCVCSNACCCGGWRSAG